MSCHHSRVEAGPHFVPVIPHVCYSLSQAAAGGSPSYRGHARGCMHSARSEPQHPQDRVSFNRGHEVDVVLKGLPCPPLALQEIYPPPRV